MDISSMADLLKRGKQFLSGLKDGGEHITAGSAFGDFHNDIELAADKHLGQFLADEARKLIPNIGKITVEGLGEVFNDDTGEHWMVIDPIDGSLNYLHAGGMIGLPFSSCVTLLKLGTPTHLQEVIGAGVIDLRPYSTNLWVSEKTSTGEYRTLVRQTNLALTRAKTLGADHLDLGRMNVIGEFYYPDNRERLTTAFAGQKGWLRNPGSAAYEMALVASGHAAAFICQTQKQHELGAGYALVLGAGGAAIDWEGNLLGARTFDFISQTPVILAANTQMAQEILELLHAHQS